MLKKRWQNKDSFLGRQACTCSELHELKYLWCELYELNLEVLCTSLIFCKHI